MGAVPQPAGDEVPARGPTSPSSGEAGGAADRARPPGGAEWDLPEPARDRLVRIAAQVAASLPPEDVPAPLRAVARFTPGKRERLGAAALLHQLDVDEQFRERVADAIREASPALGEVLGAEPDRQQLLLIDPLDATVAVVVIRPERWEQLGETLAARWLDAQAEREALAAQYERAQQELIELRRRVRSLTAELRQSRAERDVGPPAEEAPEVARLRNLLRVRTSELRSAHEDLALVRAELADVRAGAHAGTAADLESLRARVSELQRDVDAARRGRREARAQRELDDARVRVLLDTVVDAAAGLRRELDPPPSSLRPADVIAAETADPVSSAEESARTVADTGELRRLLELPHAHLVVDGYNVTKTAYPELALADQRTRLVGALGAVHARCGAEVTVVFDGAARPPVQSRAPRGVRVVFSPEGVIADDVIRELVAAEPSGRVLLVATSDQEVVTDVRRAGARTVASSLLASFLS